MKYIKSARATTSSVNSTAEHVLHVSRIILAAGYETKRVLDVLHAWMEMLNLEMEANGHEHCSRTCQDYPEKKNVISIEIYAFSNLIRIRPTSYVT